MSAYTYRDASNRAMNVSRSPFTDDAIVVVSDVGASAVRIANADAPTVALELLKAAGQESVIVPKSSLAVTTHHPDSVTDTWVTHESCGSPSEANYSVVDSSNAWLMARHWISIALKVEQVEVEAESEWLEAAARDKKLQERRDAHLRTLGYTHSWDRAKSVLQKSVDAYLELEDKLAAK